MIKTILNIMAICGTAGFMGVMISIGVTLGGYWKSLPPAEFLNWFSTNVQYVSRSIPPVFMVAFIGLAGSIWLSWNTPAFKWWLASGLCIVVVAILTFAFFVPTNTAFASKSIDVAATTAKLNQWLTIHNFRIGFAMVAAILGCIAIKG